MLPDWVVTILKSQGLAGVVIFMMAIALTWAARAYVKVSEARLNERDVLNKALTDSAQALRDITTATISRNATTEQLADAVAAQANAFDRMVDKVEFQSTTTAERLKDNTEVVKSLAESSRVLSGTVSDVRNAVVVLQGLIVSGSRE